MNFLSITSSDDMWNEVSQFAQNCSWRAGKSLSQNMTDNTFTDWERVIVALHGNNIASYCTVAKFAISYLQTLRFHQVYLISDHENLYEKYGFKVIDIKMAPWGEIEKIYMREI